MFITIFGYGSLMSTTSAKRTMPSATNFRPGILSDFSRSYNLVSISGIRSGTANLATNEVAALSIAASFKHRVCGVLFEIPLEDLSPYLEREHRYKAMQVPVLDCDTDCIVTAWTVLEQTDEEYRDSMKGGADEWESRVGQYYSGQLWGRHDIFPMRKYMVNALMAAFELGGLEWLDNMLDHTTTRGMDNRKCTLREYLIARLDGSRNGLDSLTQHFEEIRLNSELLLLDYIIK